MKKTSLPNGSFKKGERTLGTFSGVFTPSILTILGIILYLRLGYVVGNTGLGLTLLIIFLATTISVLTSVSLAAITTNFFVKVGGYYYLISRTLGVEYGGAIGIVLFFAQSISIGFYCIGFGEALAATVPNGFPFLGQIAALLLIVILFLFAWLGADWATRFQYVVMVVIGFSLLSFYAGGIPALKASLLAKNWKMTSDNVSFWLMFSIFFPAVTGFSQGVSMSGDLRDPGRSLPLGTFWAVGISTIIYISAAVVFAGTLPAGELQSNYGSMNQIASVGWLITAGVLAATMSSAMASFLGAPRILQSLAQDRVFPFLTFFGKGEGPLQNPRRGVIFSGLIALVTIGLGNLNIVATVVTMFFLISYALLNYATYYEGRSKSPAFRPTFRFFHYRLGLVGAVCCIGAMVAISMLSSIVAVAVLFGIYEYLKRTSGPARWADSKHSYHFQLMREHLLTIPQRIDHPRDWRPQVLAFSDDAERRSRLLEFASWIEGKSGLTTAVKILEGEGRKSYQMRDEEEAKIKAEIEKQKMNAFAKVIVAPDFRVGARVLIQSFGLGPIRPNTILLNGPEQIQGEGGQRKYGRSLREAILLGCNIIILHSDEDVWQILKEKKSEDRTIDIWWQDDVTGNLMLLLAYLMTRNENWENAELRVFIAGTSKNRMGKKEKLISVLKDVRITAEPKVVKSIKIDTIAKQSKHADMIFVPFHVTKSGPVGPYGVYLETVFSGLPVVALVIAAEDIDLGAEPEEGKPGEVALAMDVLAEAEREANIAEKTADRLVELLDKKISEFDKIDRENNNKERVNELRKIIQETRITMKKAIKEAQEKRKKAHKAALNVLKITGIQSEENHEGNLNNT